VSALTPRPDLLTRMKAVEPRKRCTPFARIVNRRATFLCPQAGVLSSRAHAQPNALFVRHLRSRQPRSLSSTRVIAMNPQAPILYDKGTEAKGNIYAEIHGEVGCVEDGFTVADAIHKMT
jgi:hypothetical protein